MHHFATAIHHDDLHLVARLQEALHVVQLEQVIVSANLRTHLDLLDMDHMLMFPGDSSAFGLLVLVLAVIHDTAHGRARVWRNLHQV